jgi:hypothetical protein
MKYTFGTFLISRPDTISNVRSVDDLLELTESGNATQGVPEIEKIEQLNLIVSGSHEDLLNPVASRFSGESKLFLVTRSFRDLFAGLDNDRVSKVASEWADSKSWNDTNVNPFDLYGMLHYLHAVCARGRTEGKELYLLLTTAST